MEGMNKKARGGGGVEVDSRLSVSGSFDFESNFLEI